MKKVSSVFYALFSLAFLASFVAQAAGISPLVGVGVVGGLTVIRAFVPAMGGMAFADPLTTIFTRELQKLLFPNNDFYKNSILIASGIDINAGSFEVPQELVEPTMVVNPSSFPLTYEELVDGNKVLSLDLFATAPTRLGDKEAAEVSFDKRASILSRHQAVIDRRVAATAINKWSPLAADTANIVATTGSALATGLAGATGTRKAVTKEDFIKVAETLDRMDMTGQRFALVGPTMYSQLLGITDFVDYNKTGNASALLNGQIGELLGIKIYKRSAAGIYSSANAPKAVGAAVAATDNEAALFWDGSAVGRVEGAVKVYINPAQAQYLGDIMNAAVRFGTMPMRTDKKGIVALIAGA